MEASEKRGGGAWLFYSVWGGIPSMKAWAVAETKTNTVGDLWYYDQTDGATPTIGIYSDGGVGGDPDAEVAAGS